MAKKEKSQAAEKVAKAEKAHKAKKSGKGKGIAAAPKKIATFIKDFRGETKKIVWPDSKTVLKGTGVVLAVVAFLGVIIFLIDTGLTESIKLLQNLASDFSAKDVTEAVTEAVTEVAATIAETTSAVAETTTEAVTTAVTGG